MKPKIFFSTLSLGTAIFCNLSTFGQTPVTAPSVSIVNSGDAVLSSQFNNNYYQLIGTYPGWDQSALFIAGYNYASNYGGNATKRVFIGGAYNGTPYLLMDFTTGNFGMNTSQPQSYFHAGNNDVFEIFNPNNSLNSQSHVILSTGATSAGTSAGTVTWIAKNSSGNKGLAYIGAGTVGDASTNASGKLYFATANANNPVVNMVLDNNGNVGIGSTTPAGKLQIVGPLDGSIANIEIGDPSSGNTAVPVGTSTGGYNIDFHTWRDVVNNQIGARIRAERINNYVPNSALIQSMDLAFYTSYGGDQTQLTEKLRIKSNGNVGIGTMSPDQMLTVNGTIHAKQINVDTQIPVPDYVFDRAYKLRTLSEVNRYISLNKHLPEIPSAKTMEKTGINVTELNMELLKKVEELTLYLIDKDKQISDQNKKIDAQQEQLANEQNNIQQLQQQINELSKLIKH